MTAANYTVEVSFNMSDPIDRENNIWTYEVIAPDGTVVTRGRAVGEHDAYRKASAMRAYCIANGHSAVEA